jgi:hypothetical protein
MYKLQLTVSPPPLPYPGYSSLSLMHVVDRSVVNLIVKLIRQFQRTSSGNDKRTRRKKQNLWDLTNPISSPSGFWPTSRSDEETEIVAKCDRGATSSVMRFLARQMLTAINAVRSL